jgi:pimeloyl-ACP methyl ester carboxylesterase
MKQTITHVVTLVHGTFARSAQWTKEGSVLHSYLKGRFGGAIVVTRFEWSGANTHWARTSAGSALRAQLDAQLSQYPDAAHYVVGHSHGGNIAIYATGDSELDGKVRGIVCLNTPFVCATRRTHNQVLYFLLHAFAALFAFTGAGLLVLVGGALMSKGGAFASTREILVASAIGIASFVAAWLSLKSREGVADWIVNRQGALIASDYRPYERHACTACANRAMRFLGRFQYWMPSARCPTS